MKSGHPTILALSAAAALLALAGCDAQTAQSPRIPVGNAERDRAAYGPDTSASYFAPADITFNYSQLFMWKKDVSSEQVVQVLDTIRKLEDAQDQVFLLKVKAKNLRSKFTAIGVDLQQYPDDVGTTLPAKQSQLEKAQKQEAPLKQQLEALKQQPPSDDVNAKIEALGKQIETLDKRIAKLGEQIAPILKEEQAVQAAHLEGAVQDWNTLSGDLTQWQQRASDALLPLNDLVWVFNSSPIHFSFRFTANQGIQGSIHNLDLGEISDPEVAEAGLPVDFALQNVVYNPVGGVYTFELHTPKAAYWFKVARTKYHDIDQRIHYKGDIVRCGVDGEGTPVIKYIQDFVDCGVDGGDGTPVLRRGAANLVDQDDIS